MASSDKRKDFMAEDYEPVNIDKWDGNAVKNSIDDNIKNLLKKEYNYTEDFALVDQRLILCTVACLLSLFAVVYDYFYPFPSSKYVLASCSISYFVVSGLLTLFSSYREKNIFMTGVQRGIAGLGPNDYIYVSSSLPKYSHMYTLQFTFIDGKSNRETTKSIEKSITEWFDEDGNLLMERLFNDVHPLHTSVLKPEKQE